MDKNKVKELWENAISKIDMRKYFLNFLSKKEQDKYFPYFRIDSESIRGTGSKMNASIKNCTATNNTTSIGYHCVSDNSNIYITGTDKNSIISLDSLSLVDDTRYTRQEIEQEIVKLCKEYEMDYGILSDMDDEQLIKFYNENFIEEFGKLVESQFPKNGQAAFCFEEE